MKEASQIVVLITAADALEAHHLAELLLNQRKAACVNILPRVYSSFWWQGELGSAEEHLLIVKTRAALLPEIVEMVKEAHRYQVPEIIALPIVGGNADYLEWLDSETTT